MVMEIVLTVEDELATLEPPVTAFEIRKPATTSTANAIGIAHRGTRTA